MCFAAFFFFFLPSSPKSGKVFWRGEAGDPTEMYVISAKFLTSPCFVLNFFFFLGWTKIIISFTNKQLQLQTNNYNSKQTTITYTSLALRSFGGTNYTPKGVVKLSGLCQFSFSSNGWIQTTKVWQSRSVRQSKSIQSINQKKKIRNSKQTNNNNWIESKIYQ